MKKLVVFFVLVATLVLPAYAQEEEFMRFTPELKSLIFQDYGNVLIEVPTNRPLMVHVVDYDGKDSTYVFEPQQKALVLPVFGVRSIEAVEQEVGETIPVIFFEGGEMQGIVGNERAIVFCSVQCAVVSAHYYEPREGYQSGWWINTTYLPLGKESHMAIDFVFSNAADKAFFVSEDLCTAYDFQNEMLEDTDYPDAHSGGYVMFADPARYGFSGGGRSAPYLWAEEYQRMMLGQLTEDDWNAEYYQHFAQIYPDVNAEELAKRMPVCR